MYVGTDALGRPLTSAESKELAAFLRKHDFVGASLIALNYARKRTRNNKAAAQDLLGRAQHRLVRQGWDPGAVILAKCLCRFVWSEHGNEKREDRTRRKAEEGFLREQFLEHSGASPSAEDYAVRLEDEQREEERARRRTEQLRAAFVEANDTVNLLWLEYFLEGVEEPRVMAQRSGLDPKDFYLAADRRKRHADRLLAADRGPTLEEEK
jgi:hypothetical protein